MKKRENSRDSRPSLLFSRKGALCLVLGVILAASSFWCDSLFRLSLIRAATAVKTSEIPAHAVRVSPGAQERWTILPATSADARWWIIHTTEMIKQGSLRIRTTDRDNAPDGREVHWSSLLMWVLAALSSLIGSITGKGVLDTLPEAAFYACPILYACAIAGLGWMVAKRFGFRFAVFFGIALATCCFVCQSFRFAECDHHGIVLAFAMGSVLSICCGGAGFVLPSAKRRTQNPASLELFPALSAARKWFVLSGILGAAALWVSAATFVPILIGCGFGALAAAWIGRNGGESKVSPHPELWRLWGFSGGIGCLFFYLLEYFPDHLGWRLEVNHPLYALAWLGAGELIARAIRGIRGEEWLPSSAKEWRISLLATAFVLAPPLLVVLRRDLFFWVSDQFLLSLHVEYIQEFQGLWKSLAGSGSAVILLDSFLWPAFVVLGTLSLVFLSKIPRKNCVLLLFPIFPAALMECLALLQIRWASIALGIWLVCAVMVLVVHSSGGYPGRIPAPLRWLLLIIAFLAVIVFPLRSAMAFLGRGRLADNLPKDLAPTILLRDIAHQLIQANPDRLPVVLSGVNSSTDLSYYGGIRTLGTLYWENLPGLERAARIFAATSPDEAKQLLLKAGITHIVIASWDDFGEAYVRLLKMSGKVPPTAAKPFLADLIEGNECPDWLRPLFYPIPTVFGLGDQKVRIFAVLPDQSPHDALLNTGIYFLEAGDYDRAADKLKQAQNNAPADPQIAALLSTAETKRAEEAAH
ncbi:MAG: hypothetical protein NTV93_16025 [Verrucomicrobia bacterium]|nr:hypothetical protein [Verrucomicrobiota bacterium]